MKKKNILFLFLIFFCFMCFFNFMKSNIFYKYKSRIFVSFSPYGHTENIILNFINNSNKEILLVMYNFTNKKIANSLLKAFYRGVNIKIILDGNVFKQKNFLIRYLVKNILNIRFNYLYKNMHNKFIIIDNNIVGTGSYNYTFSADHYNSENVIFLENTPKIILKYKKEFYKLWFESIKK